ncbi:hypothetical protein IAT38_007905 [Cryptococcus sp. DSM 104549]
MLIRSPSTSRSPCSSDPPSFHHPTTTQSSLKPVKRFKEAVGDEASSSTPAAAQVPPGGGHNITSLSFDDVGDRLVTAGDDDQFVLWDTRKGKKLKNFYSKKYGIDHVRFTHKSGTILHASTKGDDHAVRYHSMHDNKYLAYFKGHTARVRSIHMCPVDDTFITAGDDGTVRLWDLRSPACKGLITNVGGSALAAMDNMGVVFAVACSDTQTIMLYGAKTMDARPFAHAPLIDITLENISTPPPKPIFTSISFSNNGDYILIGTSSDVHYVVDSMDLIPLRRLVGHRGLERDANGHRDVEPRRGISGEEVSWTADSNWVVSGSASGEMLFWDLRPEAGEEKLTRKDANGGKLREDQKPDWTSIPIPEVRAAVLLHAPEEDTGASRAVRFNPRYNMLAVGGKDLTLWMPFKDEEAQLEAEGW